MLTSTIDFNSRGIVIRRGIGWGEALTVLSLCSFMGLSIALVGPRLLRASQRPNDASATETLSDGLKPQQAILEGLLAKSAWVLGIHSAQGDQSQLDTLVLWMADDRYPGEVNLSEVLVIRFSPLLRSIMAYTWTPDPEHDPILSNDDLHHLHRIEQLGSRPDVVRAVIAQSVVSCEVTGIESAQSARPDASDGPIGLRLTWIDESTDTREVSMIRTDLHLRAGAKRY